MAGLHAFKMVDDEAKGRIDSCRQAAVSLAPPSSSLLREPSVTRLQTSHLQASAAAISAEASAETVPSTRQTCPRCCGASHLKVEAGSSSDH